MNRADDSTGGGSFMWDPLLQGGAGAGCREENCLLQDSRRDRLWKFLPRQTRNSCSH